jgi:uncharacterized membrane protein YcaP (DUF421 family)
VADIVALTLPPWKIGLRATLVYVGLVLLIRLVPKRNAGHISPNDLLTLIVVGGMATDAMMSGTTSAGDILLLIAVVLAWAYLLDRLEYHVPGIRTLLRADQTPLIEAGR